MGVDDPDEVQVVGDTGTRTDEDAWTIVGGAGRCEACIKSDAQCIINVAAIERWREDHRQGKRSLLKGAKWTNCRRCSLNVKQRCLLPATEEMREGLPEKKKKGKGKEKTGSVTPSAASSSKRRMEFLGVEMPVSKRRRVNDGAGGEREWAVLAEALRRMEGTVAESSSRAVAANERLVLAIDRLTAAVAGQARATDTVVTAITEFFQGARRTQAQAERPGEGSEDDSEDSEDESNESAKEVPIEDVRKGKGKENEK